MASNVDSQTKCDQSLFECGSCHALWHDPVTLKCGHTFCRICLRKDENGCAVSCQRCSESFSCKDGSAGGFRTNVLLLAAMEKCFPGKAHRTKQSYRNDEMLLDEAFEEGTELLSDEHKRVTGRMESQENREELLTTEDFECTLCLRLLFHPITTQCGHTFCYDCIYRSLDHRIQCPLCKESLAQFLAERRTAPTEAVENIIKRFFHKELESRSNLNAKEMMKLSRFISDDHQEIPIFVCTVAFPNVPCPLRIFEPRYRLMMRRCMESGRRQFGMCACLESHEEEFFEFGTLLEIRSIEYLPDGQSFVDCVGSRRFRVMSRGVQDGYRTGEVEYLRDESPALEQMEALQNLLSKVHTEALQWFAALPPIARASIIRSFGNIPPAEAVDTIRTSVDGPAWMWYIIAILPLDQHGQLSLLSMTSLSDRLTALHRVLEYFRGHGYVS